MTTVAAARDAYFQANGFSTASYTDRWFTIEVGPIPIKLPNTRARRAAVQLHDLHHVATGYDTTYRGEAEIAAWEIAAGCGRYAAAWLLNLSAMGIGMWLAPRRVFRAFVRGRHSKSLYHRAFGEDLLAMDVDTLRRALATEDRAPRATWRDRLVFAGWLAVTVAAIPLALLSPLLIVALLLLG
jgi:hypothetical protein